MVVCVVGVIGMLVVVCGVVVGDVGCVCVMVGVVLNVC